MRKPGNARLISEAQKLEPATAVPSHRLVIDSRDLGVIDSPVRSRLPGKVIRVTKSSTHRLIGRSAKSEPPTAVRVIDPDHPV